MKEIILKINNENLGVGTPREKFAKNVAAIQVLKKCENENRYATLEEQEILSNYVGWEDYSKHLMRKIVVGQMNIEF